MKSRIEARRAHGVADRLLIWAPIRPTASAGRGKRAAATTDVGLTVGTLPRGVKTDSDNGHFEAVKFDGRSDHHPSLWGGGLVGSRDGRPNGSDAKLHGQGPRAEARAARGAPACEARECAPRDAVRF